MKFPSTQALLAYLRVEYPLPETSLMQKTSSRFERLDRFAKKVYVTKGYYTITCSPMLPNKKWIQPYLCFYPDNTTSGMWTIASSGMWAMKHDEMPSDLYEEGLRLLQFWDDLPEMYVEDGEDLIPFFGFKGDITWINPLKNLGEQMNALVVQDNACQIALYFDDPRSSSMFGFGFENYPAYDFSLRHYPDIEQLPTTPEECRRHATYYRTVADKAELVSRILSSQEGT